MMFDAEERDFLLGVHELFSTVLRQDLLVVDGALHIVTISERGWS